MPQRTKFSTKLILDAFLLIMCSIANLLQNFARSLPSQAVTLHKRFEMKNQAEMELMNKLSTLFENDPSIRKFAERGDGLLWAGYGGDYYVSLQIRYDKGSVLLTATYKEVA